VFSLTAARCSFITTALLLASGTAPAKAKALQLPEGPGKATMQKICSGCHAPEIVLGRHETKEGWEQIVSSMVDKGANGTDDEFNTIIDYLAANFQKKADSKPSSNDSGAKN
jgi:cytochrome c5